MADQVYTAVAAEMIRSAYPGLPLVDAAAYLKEKEDSLVGEGVRTVSILTIEGAAANEIISYARTAPGAVIAMSTHGRSGIQRWILCSVAEKVVRHADDPVLVVEVNENECRLGKSERN